LIQVEPTGISFETYADETIMAAAIRNGYTWPTNCGGQGTCKTCVFMILEGEDNLTEIEPWEATGLDSVIDVLPNAEQRIRRKQDGDDKTGNGQQAGTR
jgi:ferredoxin